MIYSIVPPEQLFFDGWENTIVELQDVQLGGVTMQVTREADGKMRIVRLISANPYDYLNPAFAPGSVFRFVPVWE